MRHSFVRFYYFKQKVSNPLYSPKVASRLTSTNCHVASFFRTQARCACIQRWRSQATQLSVPTASRWGRKISPWMDLMFSAQSQWWFDCTVPLTSSMLQGHKRFSLSSRGWLDWHSCSWWPWATPWSHNLCPKDWDEMSWNKLSLFKRFFVCPFILQVGERSVHVLSGDREGVRGDIYAP